VFIAPWLRHRDSSKLQVLVFSNGAEDPMSLSLKSTVDAWHDIRTMDDESVLSLTRSHAVDVLVDLHGHTAGHRLTLFGRRAAPVQVSWLGYPSTTGVPNMDAVLTDGHTVPVGHEVAFTESVVRLPGLRLAYEPPSYAPQVVPPPALCNRNITFGSFNNLAKLTPQVLGAWAAILRSVPHSRLLLKWKSLSDDSIRSRMLAHFIDQGIDPSRVLLRGWSDHLTMLNEYAEVDIALDPFPFSGGLTSCDALCMGVPVLTLEGLLPIGRQTASFLRVMNLDHWVTTSVDSYVQRAAELAADLQALAAMRSRLRAMLQASPLGDGPAFAAAVDAAFLELAKPSATYR